jgi:hypothetical protein
MGHFPLWAVEEPKALLRGARPQTVSNSPTSISRMNPAGAQLPSAQQG